MAQVPYSPVPNVVPNAPGAAPVRIDTPPAAFGVTIAEAEKGLGQTTEQAGNTLAERALAIKGLENETWAKGAFVDAAAKVGEKDAQFYSLRGQDAVNARPQYEQDIRGIYTDAINNAPNAQARSMLGDALARRISYSIDDGQKHAGQQQLEAMNAVSGSRVKGAIADAAIHADNDAAFATSLSTIRSEARAQAEHAGVPETYQVNADNWTGEAWYQRIKSIAFNDPMRASELYADNKDKIKGANAGGESYQSLIEATIQQRMDVVGVAQVADQIMTQALFPDDIKPGDIKVDKDGNEIPQQNATQALKNAGPDFLAKALDAARQWSNDNRQTAQFENLLETKIISEYNHFHDAIRQAEYGTFLNLYGAAIGANGGQRITSMDSIFNSPILNDQYQQLAKDNPARAQQIQNVVRNSANQGTMDPLAADQQYHKILGMALEAERNPDARDQFEKLDVSQFAGQLPKAYIDDIFKHQQKVSDVWAKKAEADNHLQYAMSFLRPTLASAGIRPGADPTSNDLYMTFEGAMYEKLTAAEQAKGQPIRDQAEIMKIAQPILQNIGGGSNWVSRMWYGSGKPVFQPSSEQAATMSANFKKVNGFDPNPFQLGQVFMKILSQPKGSPQRKELGLD